ncbi:MAG: hypothetical protein HY553_17530 [Elusimicrobia bacterium]|nr:hypothetical protein [Elusimicrobiota bacterium]
MRLLRLLSYAGAGYLAFRVGFPDEGAPGIYHAVTVPVLIGGAVGVFILLKAIDLGSRGLALGIELGFGAAVFLYLGFTLPQQSGRAPLSQVLSGEVPRRAQARKGLEKIGLDPEGPAGVLTKIFPE